jgi:hypothetical protein
VEVFFLVLFGDVMLRVRFFMRRQLRRRLGKANRYRYLL